MELSAFASFPDELIEDVVSHLSPRDTVKFGRTCQNANKIASDPLIWRKHCVEGWEFWSPQRGFHTKRTLRPADVDWRGLYKDRCKIDADALSTFDAIVQGDMQFRMHRIESLTDRGHDIKDLMLKQIHNTPKDGEDVLARTYFARVVLKKIDRGIAIAVWTRVSRREMTRLEDVAGSFDTFILNNPSANLSYIEMRLDQLAQAIKDRTDDFDSLSTRKKAVLIAEHMRDSRLAVNSFEEGYHDLWNNFISLLLEGRGQSLPLQCVVTYCAVARRLGLNARPSSYPGHAHVIIESPKHVTLDGRPRPSSQDTTEYEPERMHMDPWRSTEEVSESVLIHRLAQMGVPKEQRSQCLGTASNLETAIRISRNIMNSVQENEQRMRGAGRGLVDSEQINFAWYSVLWAMMILEDSSMIATMNRRQDFLGHIIGHYQEHCPEDTDLIESLIAPMFNMHPVHADLMRLVEAARTKDKNPAPASPRPPKGTEDVVKYKIGSYFRHKRYGYAGAIVGWDNTCRAGDVWIEQMGVDRSLAGGRFQPFYNIVADDGSSRYVAEENIEILHVDQPDVWLMGRVGKYFKRWDSSTQRFVNNMRDQYPDD